MIKNGWSYIISKILSFEWLIMILITILYWLWLDSWEYIIMFFENLSYLEFCFNGRFVTYNVGVNMSLIVLRDEENENDFKIKTVFHFHNINSNKNNIIEMIWQIGLRNIFSVQFSNVIEIYPALNCFWQIQWIQYLKRKEKRDCYL